MKTLGILGGVGPQTTAEIYQAIINSIKNNNGKKYPPIIIYNLPFPFEIENKAIIQGIGSEKMIPYLIAGAKILEKSGVNFGILPCNTLHKYLKEIRQSVNFPFLSILEETVLVLKNLKVKKVGILASETTVKSRFYEEMLKNEKINILYPTSHEQKIVNNIIVGLLNGTKNDSQKEKIQTVCRSLQKQGAEVILLACTDLQLICREIKTDLSIIDTTKIIINASIREMTKDQKSASFLY